MPDSRRSSIAWYGPVSTAAPYAGLLLSLLSGSMTAMGSFTIKMIPDVHPFELAVTRGIIQLMIYTPIIHCKGLTMLGQPGERLMLLSRGLISSFYLLAYYASIRLIAYSDATTINSSAPIFVYLFGWCFLGEACGLFQVSTVITTLIGVLLIAKPAFLFPSHLTDRDMDAALPDRSLGLILAVIGCTNAAISFILIRKLKQTDAMIILTSYSVGCVVLGLVSLAVIKLLLPEAAGVMSQGIRLPTEPREILWMMGNGLCGTLGEYLLCLALKIEEASLVSLGRTINIVMSLVIQVTFLPDEVIPLTSMIGGGLVCSAVSLSATKKWLKNKPNKMEWLWCCLHCGYPSDRIGDATSAYEKMQE